MLDKTAFSGSQKVALESSTFHKEDRKYLLRSYNVIGIVFDLYLSQFTVKKLRELKSLVKVT
jgi:hypothetical protein